MKLIKNKGAMEVEGNEEEQSFFCFFTLKIIFIKLSGKGMKVHFAKCI